MLEDGRTILDSRFQCGKFVELIMMHGSNCIDIKNPTSNTFNLVPEQPPLQFFFQFLCMVHIDLEKLAKRQNSKGRLFKPSLT